ncbi:RNA polymerase sigma factor 54 interaction domain protein [Acididesulfobacillus acetoxydans]|uniref:RNA polymerase sigma factor 54 interaction domain protein n=1 Tax=Acididesulfobacillus acetoxydans TaxID=1561005 RepID=A0A8S0W332_9FIRM|nr:sigma 54-interacting transcriptional regulator [Acididesulfobacillus acetoxydans]CAA7601258.1 RNA polymerase sigma factor 54 interaction domain protein [Acididesulfobacillus acetoxydans]CEJ08463.1 Signal-transduction and transcriptional-control protein [Acididesulfobacillus acetoxydans]
MSQDSVPYLRALLDIVPVAVTGVDVRGLVTHWNAVATELYGIPENEILGRPLRDFFRQDDLIVLTVLETGQPVYRSYHRPRGDRHVLINARPIFQNGELLGAVASEQDITQLINLYNDLTTANFNLERLEKAVKSHGPSGAFDHIQGESPAIKEAIRMAQKVALTDATVLITGESGVGKELFARAIHAASPYHQGPFVALNCGAIPAALFESELFGYERGAFTGAEPKGNPGKLTLAKRGTLFLDEIGDLALDLQVKLLRVLQEQSYYRLGGTAPLRLEARILAATNRSLEEMMKRGSFRRDLYFRLNVISLRIPPLRQRPEDIPAITEFLMQQFAFQYGKPAPRLSPAALNVLMEYDWPGNLRELRNVVERAVILSEGDTILPADLALPPPDETGPPHFSPASAPDREDPEKQRLLQALSQAKGNKSQAARILGITRATLYSRLQRYGHSL